ncbi:ATP-dependent helicase [candidate division KSB1 bacterium]|nr:ATP-dependent helicase [candidate division KSB1 bacterium]
MNEEELRSYLKKQEEERNKFTRRILESTCPKKVIVSGPGTGKTYTFYELLKRKQGNYLALTFINNLAEKLKKDLKDIAKSRTFHSFCKELLHKINHEGIDDDFILFPKLELIIKSDARISYNKDPNFSRSFKQLDYESKNISFFLRRSNYYNAVSFDDSVFRVLEYFREKPDEVPKYDQIVVDEYQDFNKLEVEFINILETKSPILIVGDDDQALYTRLKYASPQYIREKFKDPKYKRFMLPFCSRCPYVMIKAIDDVINKAKQIGKLMNRVNKEYICYLPEKLQDSKKYPKIIHAYCSVQQKNAPYVAKFIEQEIDKLTLDEIKESNSKGDYTVLITGPKQYLKQINSYLKRDEKYILHFRKIEIEQKKISINDGYKILLDEDKFSNLGWRILLEHDPIKNIGNLLKKTLKDGEKRLYDYLPKSYIKKHEVNLGIFEKLKNDMELNREEREILEDFFRVKLEDLKAEFSKDEDGEKRDGGESFSLDYISVALTTYVGCKGLSAGYVFIVGLNEGNLPRSNKNPSDIEICQLIVALARTIKKCYLISTTRFAGRFEGNRSIFIGWINKKRIAYEEVNAGYWKNR